MPTNAPLTILIADEDGLRRDGLFAILSANNDLEIVACVSDGETAFDQIRKRRPDVAIVDLNLPRLHGIELVRRIRSEALGTKVIVLDGAADDEIVGEVVRAGGDGYLVKNGPVRHLLDAISYVRDGGRYFSPQLRRNGVDFPSRDRLLFENSSLGDRDREIMVATAGGMRPILDRLDEIEERVTQMECGDAPIPADPRNWLSSQLASTLGGAPGNPGALSSDAAVLGRAVNDLELQLPKLIEETVTRHFHQMADRLQQEIEETHVRTLETFVRNIQVKLVQRVSALEHDMSVQSEAMHQFREYSQRTDDHLGRLISGVDRLAQELPKLLQAPESENPVAIREARAHEPGLPRLPKRRVSSGNTSSRNTRSGNTSVKILRVSVAGLAVLGFLILGGARFLRQRPSPPIQTTSPVSAEANKPAVPAPASAVADTKTKLQAAREHADRNDYPMAEDIYRQVVRTEPANVEALKALASVLYREDKIAESATVLDRIPK